MKSPILPILIVAIGLALSSPLTLATEIRFKPGERDLLAFLEEASEKLDIAVDVSSIGGEHLGVITVADTGPLSPERAKAAVLTTLYLQGYTWVHDNSTDLYRVLRQRDARDQELPLITDERKLPDSDELVTYYLPLKDVPAEFVARTARSFMPANSRIIPDDTTGSVIITDSAHNISKLANLIRRMDTPQAAKDARDILLARAKSANAPCPGTPAATQPPSGLLIALFALIAAVIGFLARGYAIRRIEGGL